MDQRENLDGREEMTEEQPAQEDRDVSRRIERGGLHAGQGGRAEKLMEIE